MTPQGVLKSYEERINLHKFSEVEALISEAATFWFSNGTHRGKREVQAAFERTWDLIQNERYWLTDVEWLAEGETAATCIYTFHWRGVIGGQEKEGSGRGTSILRRENSTWKIVHEHLSNFPNDQL